METALHMYFKKLSYLIEQPGKAQALELSTTDRKYAYCLKPVGGRDNPSSRNKPFTLNHCFGRTLVRMVALLPRMIAPAHTTWPCRRNPVVTDVVKFTGPRVVQGLVAMAVVVIKSRTRTCVTRLVKFVVPLFFATFLFFPGLPPSGTKSGPVVVP